MSKLNDLEKQLEKLKTRIESEKQKQKEQQDKKRRRMIEIVGSYYLSEAEKNRRMDELAKKLDDSGLLKKKADKSLFINEQQN